MADATPGASTASLSIAFANAADNGSYQLTVTDTDGSASTTPATVALDQNPADLDPTFAISVPGGQVLDMLPLPDGRVLLGSSGPVHGAASTSASGYLVLVQPDGRVSNVPAGAFNGSVGLLHARTDGKILVAGGFSQVGGVKPTLEGAIALRSNSGYRLQCHGHSVDRLHLLRRIG
jgi:hypothetical protein